MKLFKMLDDNRIDAQTKRRYKAIIAKVEGEYLFDDERQQLFRELARLNEQAARQIEGRR